MNHGMRLDEALSDVDAIRGQLDRVRTASCYRAATIATSGVIAIGAAFFQPNFRLEETAPGPAFLVYWTSVACLSVLIIGVEMGWRYWATATTRERNNTRQTLTEFVPSLIVGAILGLLFVTRMPQQVALLPGLWAIIFAFGVLATLGRLPKGGIWIAIHYLVSGFLCLRFSAGEQALAPWTMAVTFGIGQLWAAVILHAATVRKHALEYPSNLIIEE